MVNYYLQLLVMGQQILNTVASVKWQLGVGSTCQNKPTIKVNIKIGPNHKHPPTTKMEMGEGENPLVGNFKNLISLNLKSNSKSEHFKPE